jgi:hypothetical protein
MVIETLVDPLDPNGLYQTHKTSISLRTEGIYAYGHIRKPLKKTAIQSVTSYSNHCIQG